jgi:hypothetical protein
MRCVPKDTLSTAGYEAAPRQGSKGMTRVIYVRLPRTHNSEPVFFHSWNVSPWINHSAVPSW